MAVDEMLLERAQEQAAACLRFYGWSEPTLSLGYFQTYADRQEHPPSLPCAAVRRLTGGGAILHDAELTYSIVLPGTHPLAARRDELYQAVHGCLIEALGHFGITARLCTAADKTAADITCGRSGTVSLFSAKIAGRRADRPNQDLRQCPAAAERGGPATWQPALASIARSPRTARRGGFCHPPDRARNYGRSVAQRLGPAIGLRLAGRRTGRKRGSPGRNPCGIPLCRG